MEFNVPGFMPYESMPYAESPYDYGMDYTPVYDVAEAIGGIMIFSLVAALILAVITFVIIIPQKRRGSLNGLWKHVADLFDFKTLYTEKILKFAYSVTTYTAIIGGFAMFVYSLFEEYAGSDITRLGILIAIGGPIVIRLVYEILMMSVIAVNSLVSINNKLKSTNNEKENDINSFAHITVSADIDEESITAGTFVSNQSYSQGGYTDAAGEPENPGADMPQYCYCTQCGTRYDISKGHCPNGCGN